MNTYEIKENKTEPPTLSQPLPPPSTTTTNTIITTTTNTIITATTTTITNTHTHTQNVYLTSLVTLLENTTPWMIFFNVHFRANYLLHSSWSYYLLSNLVSNQGKSKNMVELLLERLLIYFFTKSIRFRVQRHVP